MSLMGTSPLNKKYYNIPVIDIPPTISEESSSEEDSDEDSESPEDEDEENEIDDILSNSAEENSQDFDRDEI